MLNELNETTIQRHLAQASPYTLFDAPLSVIHDKAASAKLGKKYWRVTVSFKFYVGAEIEDTWVYVPEGYLTDGATTPKFLWWLLPPWGEYGQAAVVHDILCDDLLIWKAGQLHAISRKEADDIFYEAMKVAGVSFWKRWLMYGGVRLWDILGFKANPERLALKKQLIEEWQPQ